MNNVLDCLKNTTPAWREGFIGYLTKKVSIHENKYSFNRNRAKHDDWLNGRSTARKWLENEV